MIPNTKCECGHQNPPDTILCESCGKPLAEEASANGLLEMRYEGAARRSKRANPSLLDRVWNFFSSVKVAVYLILVTLCAASLGTVFRQENTFGGVDPETFYRETYGTLGLIYYHLGLSDTFNTWWFKGLLVMIGTSLVICSLDRVIPLYRALKKQQVKKHPEFLCRQKVFYSASLPDEKSQTEAEWLQHFAGELKKRRYRVTVEGDALLAEKNRFSRWGPYVNHIGLIIFLLAVLMRSIPGWYMDEYVGIRDGEIKKIENTPYYLKNEQFSVEYYEGDKLIPKKFETKAVLYECVENCDDPLAEPVLKEVERHDIVVNKPMEYKGFMAYQYDYALDPLLVSVKAHLKDKTTGESFGTMELGMKDPKTHYTVGPYELELIHYYPEFDLNENGEIVTKSNEPRAPAFVFRITGPNLSREGDVYIYFPLEIHKEQFRQDQLNGALGNKLEIDVASMDDVQISTYVTYLNLRVDRALPFIWTGAAISMIGLVMGFYWQHRRVWVRMDGDRFLLGAHTNKNWFGLRKEVALCLEKTGFPIDPKSLANGGKRS